MSKTHVYFVPGLAASIEIFENIKLPKEQFEMHYLEWILPIYNETIQSYAKRMCEGITHKNCVLIGVSFGVSIGGKSSTLSILSMEVFSCSDII